MVRDTRGAALSPAQRALPVVLAAVLLAAAAFTTKTGPGALTSVLTPPPGSAPCAGSALQASRPDRARAEGLLAGAREALAAVQATHGASSLETAAALADLAFRTWGVEEYRAGRPLAERALALRLALGAADGDIAASFYQAADFRRATGDFAGALEAYRRAIEAWGLLHGEEDAESASAWHYLGVVHDLLGDAPASRRCLEHALALRERTLGPRDPLVATTLQALAGLAQRQGDARAEALYARAQAIWETALGPSHPFIARSLIARASVLSEAGDFAAASRLLDRAMAIRVAAFGSDHHLVAQLRRARGDLLAAAGEDEAAAREYGEAVDGLRKALGPEHPEVGAAMAGLARLEWSAGRRRQAVATALEAERIGRSQFLLSAHGLEADPALRFAAGRTSGLDVALSFLADRPAGAPSGAVERRILDALVVARALVLEALPESDAGVSSRGGASPEGLGFADVARAVPADGALVAYARYVRLPETGSAGTASYLAVVVRGGADDAVIVPLGEAGGIDALVAAWRGEAAVDPRPRGRAGTEAAARAEGTRLRAAFWDPLAGALQGAGLVLVVPDGALDLVSFAALPSGTDRFLLDDGPMFHYLTAERDLLRPPSVGGFGRGLLMVGAPDFAAPAAPAEGAMPASLAVPSAARPTCTEFGALSFAPLPGALAETNEVATLFAAGETSLLQGEGATAAAFAARAPGRRILHLATHGYVLPDSCAEIPTAQDLGPGPGVLTEERQLLRSGLAFAGANRGDGGGFLSGEQIARLDLSGVEWVVLSGCDTGLGDLRAGEGVVGLRHAFQHAGAGTVVMSLWGADDGAARAFMRALYTARGAGLSTAEAMRQAASELLGFQRRAGRSTHPYYWGGFVAAGDWH
jgi:CHAT domain-containing protein/tetratricopeptide (TPR) repeat protein